MESVFHLRSLRKGPAVIQKRPVGRKVWHGLVRTGYTRELTWPLLQRTSRAESKMPTCRLTAVPAV
jgi:hypothetical protein